MRECTQAETRVPQRVLLVSPFFYPEAISTGKYNTVVAEALAGRGAEVTVISSHPLYPGWKPQKSEAALAGMRILRGGASVRYSRSVVIRRLVLEAWFAWHAFWRALFLRESPDVVVAVLPPSVFSLLLTWLHPRSHKVGIVHDLQGVHAKAHGGLVSRIAASVERAAFRSFDQLIFVSKSMARCATENGGVDVGKVTVCYPFVSVKPCVTRNALETDFPRDFQHVVYSGALGKKQKPEQLMSIFESAAQQMPQVMFHVFSEGTVFDALKRDYEGRGVERLAFHPLVAEEDLAELYARSDVQVVPQAENTSEGAFPSKLPNLLASGCAVFAICNEASELNEVVQKAGTGLSHNDWESQSVVRSLEALLARVRGESHAERARKAEPVVRDMFGLSKLLDCILDPFSRIGCEG
jgi:hypothetical protein